MKIKAVSGIMLILLSTLILTGCHTPVSASDTNLTGEIAIGALLSMTGDLAAFGENHKAAAELAVEEVNAFSQASGMSWVMNLVVEDTVTDPDIALEKVESLAARGIELVVGPLSSSEVRAIKGHCDANKILVKSVLDCARLGYRR
jgi:branched-chain amino acid transport system substrate-binding protein